MTSVAEIARRIEVLLQQPAYFRDVLDALSGEPYRNVLQAWSDVRLRHALVRDEQGRYVLAPPG